MVVLPARIISYKTRQGTHFPGSFFSIIPICWNHYLIVTERETKWLLMNLAMSLSQELCC